MWITIKTIYGWAWRIGVFVALIPSVVILTLLVEILDRNGFYDNN